MPLILSVNQSNITSSNNNEFTFKFPAGTLRLPEGTKMAVSSIFQYYSNFNVNGTYNNYQISYYWIDGTLNTINLDYGNYSVFELNLAFEYGMYVNKHYFLNASGQTVYLLKFVINQPAYAVQLFSYSSPTSIDNDNLTIPAGATWSFPTTSIYPQFYFQSNSTFSSLIGFPNTNYIFPTSNAGSKPLDVASINSPNSPEISPASCYLVSCSIVNNKSNNPSTLLYSYSSTGVTFGALTSIQNSYPIFVPVIAGSYTQFRITITDQNYNAVKFQDPSTLITLILKFPEDN